jgi:cytochrome P450
MNELFNPHSNEWLLNKFDAYKDLRSRDKAYWSEKYQVHVLTRYEDVMFALSNPDIFSSAQGNLVVEDPERFGLTLGASDNPEHDAYKNIVKNAYGKDNIARILRSTKPKLAKIFKNASELNISEVIEGVSSSVVAELLNLPYKKKKVEDLIFALQRYGAMCVSENVNEIFDIKIKKIIGFIVNNQGQHIPSPGPGLYHEFITNNPEKLSVISLFVGPCVSGASSMTGGLEFLVLDLYRSGVLEKVYNDRSLVPLAINESLRFNASTGRFRRTVTKNVTIHGVDLKPGDAVVLSLESANRDPKKFENPDEFILERNTAGVAFGHGLHACIALAIAKATMHVFINSLFDNFGLYKVTTENKDLRYVMTQSGNDDMISNIHIERN